MFDGTSPTFYFTNTSGWNTSSSLSFLTCLSVKNLYYSSETSENQDVHCTGYAYTSPVVVNNNSIQPESHAPVTNPASKTQIQHTYIKTEQNIVDDDDDEPTAFENTKFMMQVFWNVTKCCCGTRHFKQSQCLHLRRSVSSICQYLTPADEITTIFRNVVESLPNPSRPVRPQILITTAGHLAKLSSATEVVCSCGRQT